MPGAVSDVAGRDAMHAAFERLEDDRTPSTTPRRAYHLRATTTSRRWSVATSSASARRRRAVEDGEDDGSSAGADARTRATGRRAETTARTETRSGWETPGNFAFATPMRDDGGKTASPRTPSLTRDSPCAARLDALLAAPVKPNFGVQRTPNATPLKLRFDGFEVEKPKKRARGKVSDVFRATKSAATPARLTRAKRGRV